MENKVHSETNVYIVILAGGKGERLWPLSREKSPKQLLSFINQRSLLEHTTERIEQVATKDKRLIVTTLSHAEAIKRLVSHSIGKIVIEPAMCNTAPAILLTCFEIYEKDPNAVIAFLPADHYIPDSDSFIQYFNAALTYAKMHDDITLLGIKPLWPATGYGYIEFEKADDKHTVHRVKHFHEKPMPEVAKVYYAADTMLWNAGMFCAKVKTFLQEFKTCAPNLYLNMKKYLEGSIQYTELENISIDYAVLEKSKNIAVLPADFVWSDVGNLDIFLSLIKEFDFDQDNIIEIDSKNNRILAKDKLTALIGVENLCVVQTDDVLLIAKRDDVEKVKLVLRQLKENKLRHYL